MVRIVYIPKRYGIEGITKEAWCSEEIGVRPFGVFNTLLTLERSAHFEAIDQRDGSSGRCSPAFLSTSLTFRKIQGRRTLCPNSHLP
jgi:hypothetical protein